jgi:hypothetical protein
VVQRAGRHYANVASLAVLTPCIVFAASTSSSSSRNDHHLIVLAGLWPLAHRFIQHHHLATTII